MKLVKNFFITINSKGLFVTLNAIKNFLIILINNFFSFSKLIKKKIFNFEMYLDPKDRGISRTLLLFGNRELDHKIILETVLKKDMKIFDIGANIGYYVLMQSKLIGKKGKILAVEPVRKNMKLLKKNLELNKNNITRTIQVAVTNKKKFKKFNGSEIFYTTSHSNIGRLDNKIKNDKNKKFITSTLYLERLIKDNFNPDLIRMDIEGSEVDILNDLTDIKLKKYPTICFETHISQYLLRNKNNNLPKMDKTLRKMFKIGYRVRFASTSYELGSKKLKKLGYKPFYKNIKTDDVNREIYMNLKNKDALKLICYEGGLRTILMSR